MPSFEEILHVQTLELSYTLEVLNTVEVSRTRLDVALNNLVKWKVFLPMAGALEPDHLEGPFWYDSMTT